MFTTSINVKASSSSIAGIDRVARQWNSIVGNSKIVVVVTGVEKGFWSTKVTARIDIAATNARNAAPALLQVAKLVG